MSFETLSPLNQLIDAATVLDTSLSVNDAWLSAVSLVEQAGYNALNVFEIGCSEGEVNWFRSSMSTDWLNDYVAQGFMGDDPIVSGTIRGLSEMRLVDGVLLDVSPCAPLNQDLRDQLLSFDYHTLDTHVFAGQSSQTSKGVVVARGERAPMPEHHHRLFCAIIGTAVHPPIARDDPGAIDMGQTYLTAREIDALSFLASGLRNDAIAYKMGIAEITVRAHIANARQKLGASTREEAVAIAIRNGKLPL